MRNVTDPTAEPGFKRPGDRRMLATVIGLIGAACLIVAAFSKSWMGNPRFNGVVRDSEGNASREGDRYMNFQGDIRFGPLGFEQCPSARGASALDLLDEPPADGACRTLSTTEFNDEVGEAAQLDHDKYTSEAFARAGWLAFGACLLAAAALLVSAGLVLARVKKDLPVSPASIALLGLMSAMVAGCVFVATKPGPTGMVGVDLGFWVFGAGTVIGILGAQMLAKELRPPDPDLLEGAIDPAEFAAFPAGPGAPAASAVPVPLGDVPPTQPVEAIADSPGGARKPGDDSA